MYRLGKSLYKQMAQPPPPHTPEGMISAELQRNGKGLSGEKESDLILSAEAHWIRESLSREHKMRPCRGFCCAACIFNEMTVFSSPSHPRTSSPGPWQLCLPAFSHSCLCDLHMLVNQHEPFWKTQLGNIVVQVHVNYSDSSRDSWEKSEFSGH